MRQHIERQNVERLLGCLSTETDPASGHSWAIAGVSAWQGLPKGLFLPPAWLERAGGQPAPRIWWRAISLCLVF